MLCSTTIPYQRLGILLTISITISFLVAMLFFGAVSHVIGPEEGFGDLTCSKKEKETPIQLELARQSS